MGYTHYWYQHKNITDEQWNQFTDFVRKALAKFNGSTWYNSSIGEIPEKPIKIVREYDSEDEAVIAHDYVQFNGYGDDGHETFYVNRNDVDFQFCKTARKPYDTLVLACVIAGYNTGVFYKWSTDARSKKEMASALALYYKCR